MTLRQAAGAQARRAGVGALRRVFGEPGRAGGWAFRLVCRQGFGNLFDFAFRLFQRPADFFRYLLQFLLHARIISLLGSDQKMSRRMRDLRKNRVLFQASNSIFGPVFDIGASCPPLRDAVFSGLSFPKAKEKVRSTNILCAPCKFSGSPSQRVNSIEH